MCRFCVDLCRFCVDLCRFLSLGLDSSEISGTLRNFLQNFENECVDVVSILCRSVSILCRFVSIPAPGARFF